MIPSGAGLEVGVADIYGVDRSVVFMMFGMDGDLS